MANDKKVEDGVFSHPVRSMTAEEIDQIAGGEFSEEQALGKKASGWPDNQSKNET